ncbi:tyramine receptor 1 [Eupeodes corollae]|uniref:tyramine receptor 1 n=1 Tax=Eupeodes corollae TaxID=290404 RepID=UPI0024927F63|nr:tyramine receptor 1 [Eupeodes corollae]
MAFNTIDSNEFRGDNSEENEDSIKKNDIPSIMDSELTSFSPGQYITFTVIVVILCGLSVVGNMGALYTIQKRKMRLFFRSCLISLALSDLIQTVFMSTGYVAQFSAPYVQVWCLGEAMCIFIPFVTTGAILAGGMTLVGIAMDRYFAVMSSILGSWNPSRTFCILSVTGIWALSYGIASPMYSAYSTYKVYILRSMGLEFERDDSEVIGLTLVEMCVSEKKSNAYYYIVVLAIIFIPTLVAFVWLNSIIANKLWIRRHSINAPPAAPPQPQPGKARAKLETPTPSPSPTQTQTQTPTTTSLSAALSLNRKPLEKQMEIEQQQYEYDHPCHCQGGHKICSYSTLTVPTTTATRSMVATTTTTITTTTTVKSLERETHLHEHDNNAKTNSNVVGATAAGGNSAKHISTREARHLRMFAIVLILMAVFIFFRLPAWVFLIMRMYGTYTRPVHWILHFSFGILTLTSCVLNPLLYTFLAETIQYTLLMKGKLCGLRRFFGNRVGQNNCGRTIQRRRRCHSDDDDGNGNKDNKDNDNYNGKDDNMTHIPKQLQNVKKLNFNCKDDGDGYGDGDGDDDKGHAKDADDDDCCCKDVVVFASNDGAKSTSKTSNDESNAKVYTILIPVLQREVM